MERRVPAGRYAGMAVPGAVPAVGHTESTDSIFIFRTAALNGLTI